MVIGIILTADERMGGSADLQSPLWIGQDSRVAAKAD